MKSLPRFDARKPETCLEPVLDRLKGELVELHLLHDGGIVVPQHEEERGAEERVVVEVLHELLNDPLLLLDPSPPLRDELPLLVSFFRHCHFSFSVTCTSPSGGIGSLMCSSMSLICESSSYTPACVIESRRHFSGLSMSRLLRSG